MPPKSTPSKEHHSPPASEETSDAHADAPTIAFVGERRVAKQQKEVWRTWPHTRQRACSVPITVADVTIQFESVSEATLKNKEMPEGWQNRNGHQMWKLQQAPSPCLLYSTESLSTCLAEMAKHGEQRSSFKPLAFLLLLAWHFSFARYVVILPAKPTS